MFPNLLPEIQEEIIKYCSVVELKNLALTSSECNETVKQSLFHTIRVPKEREKGCFFIDDKILCNWQYTKVLHISGGFIPQDAFKTISTLNNLIELDIYDSKGTHDVSLGILCDGLGGLKVLKIGNRKITNQGLIYIQKLPSLEELVLNGHRITDKKLFHHVTLSTLKKLDVSYCGSINDEGFLHISKLNLIEELAFCQCKVTNIGFFHIASLKTLKKLNLRDCRSITASNCISHISSLIMLEELDLFNCRITDVELSYIIGTLTALKKLNIGLSHITDEGCSHLSNLCMLKELDLRCCFISDMGLSYISSLVTLKKLDLSNCRNITDVGMSHITTLSMVEDLLLSGCAITDVGLSHVSSLITLKRLAVDRCWYISDTGISYITSNLGMLKELYVNGTRLSTEVTNYISERF